MKVFLSLCAFGLCLSAQAGPKVQRQHFKTLIQDDEEKFVLVTGSNLPQRVKLRSIGTTTPYNVRIYTNRELQSTGRSTVAGALSVLDPSIQISHGH